MNDEPTTDQTAVQTESNWQYQNEQESLAGSDMAESVGVPMQDIPAVKWTASEFVSHEKNTAWYATLMLASVVMVALVFSLTRDFLATVAVLLACSAMIVYAGRKPGTKDYTIDEAGVKIDERVYNYHELKSFSVVEEGAIDSIWLKPVKRFAPMVVMYFPPDEEQNIINVLSNFLAQEDRQLDAIDRFSKKIRF